MGRARRRQRDQGRLDERAQPALPGRHALQRSRSMRTPSASTTSATSRSRPSSPTEAHLPDRRAPGARLPQQRSRAALGRAGTRSLMQAAVLVFPGINRERDMARTLQARLRPRAGDGVARRARRCRPAPISWSFRAASPTATTCAAARSRRARRSWTRCARMRRSGGLVLGVCNGFQILCESGLLAGRADAQRSSSSSSAATSICGSSVPTRRSRAATMPAR